MSKDTNELIKSNYGRMEGGDTEIRKAVPFRMANEPVPVKKGEKKPVELTDEQLEERRKNVLESMGYDTGLAKDEPKVKTPEEIEAERVAAEAAAVEAAKEPTETAEEKAKREEDEALAAQKEKERLEEAKEDERNARSAAATAKAVKEALEVTNRKETPAEAPEAATVNLDPEDRADLEAVEWLAVNAPEKLPKGTNPETFVAYYKALYDYRAKWLKDNEGKEFNAADEEHKEFLEKNQPDVAIEVIDEARDEVKFERRFSQRVAPKLEAIDVQRTLEKTAPKIATSINTSIVKLAEAVAPEVHKIITKDGKIDLGPEAIKAIDAADPVAKVVLEEIIAAELQPAIIVLEQSAALGNKFPWDLKNVHHQRVLDEIIDCEKIMADAPAKVRMQKGKEFIAMAAMQEKRDAVIKRRLTPASTNEAMLALDRQYWTLSADDLNRTLIGKCADKAIGKINFMEALAAKKNGVAFVPRVKGAASKAAVAPKTPTPPAPVRGKPAPPKVGGGADLIAPPGGAAPVSKSFGESAAVLHFK